MELDKLIRSRVHRTLRNFDNYKQIWGTQFLPSYIEEISLQTGERFIGVYENLSGERYESIVISTYGLHLFLNETWVFIGYDQISQIEPPPKQPPPEEVTIQLDAGQVVNIPVRGKHNGFQDIWEFLRFLARATDDFRGTLQ